MRLARWGIARLHQLEQRWSRFLPTSEISGLNRAEGAARIATADTVRLVQALVQAWHATAGSFDPTLLGTLVELGYASSRDDATLRTSLAAEVAPQGNPAGILVDATTGWIQLPRGTTLDPGGLGKGLAADIVVEQLILDGATCALVEIGGDIRVAGTPPVGDAWTIAVVPGDRRPAAPHRATRSGWSRHLDLPAPDLDPAGRAASPPARPPNPATGRHRSRVVHGGRRNGGVGGGIHEGRLR